MIGTILVIELWSLLDLLRVAVNIITTNLVEFVGDRKSVARLQLPAKVAALIVIGRLTYIVLTDALSRI